MTKTTSLSLLGCALALSTAILSGQTNYDPQGFYFTTLAGLPPGWTDGTGAAARFRGPGGVAVDSNGNVFVADSLNSTIRKIAPGGVVTTLAGTVGVVGSADGTGTHAQFAFPGGVAIDVAGNIVVADTSNNTIRRITPAGVVTTLAGTAGVAGSADGPVAAATFRAPNGVAVDSSGNIYVADQGNQTIRKITPAGAVTTLAGTAGVMGSANGTGPAAQFNNPGSVAVDGAKNVYVADQVNQTIREITPGGVVTTLAGTVGVSGSADGTGVAATFDVPVGVAADSAGNVYVADNINDTIRKIDTGGVVTTLAGTAGVSGSANGTGPAARFRSPLGVGLDGAGNVYVADSQNNTIREITPAGAVTTLAGTSGFGSADGAGQAARFSSLGNMAVDGFGAVYVLDGANGIRKISAAGLVSTLTGVPSGVALAVDSSNNLYVAGGTTVSRITPGGVVTTLASNFDDANGVAVDSTGNVYVCNGHANNIGKITPGGVVTIFAGNGVYGSSVASSGFMDGTGAAAEFAYPDGVAVDSTGNVYVADWLNYRIRKITPGGVVTTLAGSATSGNADGTGSAASFALPTAVAVDGAGFVYVACRYNDRIRRISGAGVVTTIGGADGQGNIGGFADGPGTVARFSAPTGIAVDSSGNVFVSDSGNDVVRRGTPLPVIITQPASQTVATSYTVTFSATAFSSPTPTYQWQKNGVNIAGATGSSYTIASVAAGDAGSYTVVITNLGGSVTSSGATLVVSAAVPAVAHAADFNGDGNSDLLWQDTLNGDRLIWLMNGITPITAVDLGSIPADWSIAAIGDFNGDGVPDLVWQNTVTGERLIWIMSGATPVDAVSLGTVSTDWLIVGAGDLNGDGVPDLLWTNTVTSERTVWLMNGTTPSATVSLGLVPFQWSLAGTGDFNGDGKTDLLWDNTLTGAISVWLMNGTTQTSAVSVGVVSPQLQVAGVGDYNGDGHPDILWTNRFTGERSIWLMSGTTHTSTASLGTLPLNWVLIHPVPQRVWADLNSDGQSDLVWQNTATGASLVYLMDGTAPFTAVSLGTSDPNVQIAAIGDFNADGKADLVWQNSATGDRFIWLMNGTTPASSVDLGVVSTDWSIIGTGDFNADGYSDLIWKNTSTGEYLIWLMNGTTPLNSISLGAIDPNLQFAGTGDFNSDGNTDLLWQNTSTGERFVWLMSGTTMSSSVSLGTVSTEWSLSGTGDFNGDGQTDLLWVNTTTGERLIWLMYGTTPFNAVSLGDYPTGWSIKN